MNQARNSTVSSGIGRLLRETAAFPEKLESNLRTRPLATVSLVAGVAFVAGTVVGSRLLRAMAVATLPVLLQRALQGALGEQLDAFLAGGARGSSRDPS